MSLVDRMERWLGMPVLVVGDAMLDVSTHVQVRGPNPEDEDSLVYRRISRRSLPGGAANAAANLAGMGAQVTLIAAVGNDSAGRRIDAALGDEGVDVRLVVCDQPTTIKHRVLENMFPLLRIDVDQVPPLGSKYEGALAREFNNAALLLQPSGLLLSDYGKGVLQSEPLLEQIAHSEPSFSSIVLDPKRSLLQGKIPLDAVTPNTAEADRLGGAWRDRFFAVLPGVTVVETAGHAGARIWRERKGDPIQVPTEYVERAHICGAGDTFASALLLARLGGADWEEATAIANVAAGVAVRTPETAVVTVDALRSALHYKEKSCGRLTS